MTPCSRTALGLSAQQNLSLPLDAEASVGLSQEPGRRIALIGSYAPSLVAFRGQLIKQLVHRGHQVFALAPAISPQIAEQLRAMGAEPREVRVTRNSLNPFRLVISLASIAKAIRETGATVIFPYTVQPVTIGSLASALAGAARIVPIITGLGYAFSDAGGLRRAVARAGLAALYRRSLARSSLVIFQNRDDAADLSACAALPADKPTIIVNGSGVDLGYYSVRPLPGQPHFLMLARLLSDKGVREYAEAARRLKARYPHARFALAGWFDNAPSRISATELSRMMAGGIDYLGHLNDVRPALADAQVYVLPSRYREGTPRSSLEAMSMGRPIITSDVPGCRETVIDGSNGLLVPPCDAARLCEAMERFIVEPQLAGRMGLRSREIAERRFDDRVVAREIIEAAGL